MAKRGPVLLKGSTIPARRSVQLKITEMFAVSTVSTECPQIISSNWFWTHPGTGERKGLVPAKGHAVCTRRVGRRCAWRRPLDGTGSLLDNFLNLDFCHHKRQRTKCKECGGSEICTHDRVRYQCRECKPAHKLQVAAGTVRNERRSSTCLPVVTVVCPCGYPLSHGLRFFHFFLVESLTV